MLSLSPLDRRTIGTGTYLAGVLQQVLPLLCAQPGLVLQRVEVRELPVRAERQDEEVVELLRLGRPLALDDACTRPRRLSDVVSILLLLRASVRDAERGSYLSHPNPGHAQLNIPELGKRVGYRETAIRRSAVGQESLRSGKLWHRVRKGPSLQMVVLGDPSRERKPGRKWERMGCAIACLRVSQGTDAER